MPTENKIGANIASLRRARGLTQAELARQLHYTHQTVSNWERGISEPDAETLLRLSAFFGVSADEILIGRQGSAFAEEGAEEEKEAPGAAPVHNRGFRVSPTSAREHAVFLDAEAFSLRESAAAAEKARTVPVRRRRRVKASDLRTVLIVCTACTFVRYFFSLFGNAAALVFIALSAGLAESALRLAAAILFFFVKAPSSVPAFVSIAAFFALGEARGAALLFLPSGSPDLILYFSVAVLVCTALCSYAFPFAFRRERESACRKWYFIFVTAQIAFVLMATFLTPAWGSGVFGFLARVLEVGDISLVPVLLAGEQGRMRTLKVQSPPSQAAFFQTLLFYYMVGKFSVN